MARALHADTDSKARFDALAYSHRKEFARWIAEAKKDDTRERRVAQALEMLRKGRTRSWQADEPRTERCGVLN